MWNAEKEMVECLIFIFSAFQLPHSEVPEPFFWYPSVTMSYELPAVS